MKISCVLIVIGSIALAPVPAILCTAVLQFRSNEYVKQTQHGYNDNRKT